MTKTEKSWTGNIHLGAKVDIDVVLNQLVHAFNSSPFFKHNGMSMRVVEGQIEAYVEMQVRRNLLRRSALGHAALYPVGGRPLLDCRVWRSGGSRGLGLPADLLPRPSAHRSASSSR